VGASFFPEREERGLGRAPNSGANAKSAPEPSLQERDRMFPSGGVDPDDDDRDGTPARQFFGARAHAAASIRRPAHEVLRIEQKVHDGVSTSTDARSGPAAERRTGASRELEMELGRERDVESERTLERAAVRDEGVDARFGLDALRANRRRYHARRHDTEERSDRESCCSQRGCARWRLSSSV
jgi:hypothetical protein